MFYIAEVQNSGDKLELPVDIEGLIVHAYVKSATPQERRTALVAALRTDAAFEGLRAKQGCEPYISPDALDRQTANIVSSADARVALARVFPTRSSWGQAEVADIGTILRPYALEVIAPAVKKLMATLQSVQM